jgi:hypothetical protein
VGHNEVFYSGFVKVAAIVLVGLSFPLQAQLGKTLLPSSLRLLAKLIFLCSVTVDACVLSAGGQPKCLDAAYFIRPSRAPLVQLAKRKPV